MNEMSPPVGLDRPNSYIGRSVERPNAPRLTQGRGRFVDDITLPRMVHVAYARSPYAHAEIKSIDVSAAKALAGVVRVATMADIEEFCTPWVGVLDHLKGIKSAAQWPLANGKVFSQGEPVEAHTDPEASLAKDAVPMHAELGDNLCFERTIDAGDTSGALNAAAHVVDASMRFNRHTGVTLEPRSIICDYDAAEQALTLYMSVQCPHMSKNLFAKHLNLDENKVRVICGDVGGSFGIKIHTYPDEMTAAALSVMLGRPVKFVADRLESFVTDIHARDHQVEARMAVDGDGRITGLHLEDTTGIGPYSVYPRTSGIEINQVLNLTGGPYAHPSYHAHGRVVFQN